MMMLYHTRGARFDLILHTDITGTVTTVVVARSIAGRFFFLVHHDRCSASLDACGRLFRL
jgi:uncharacterized membrane protein